MPVFVVQASGSDASALERARFVRDGFSWPAFAFAQFWLLYHRLWLALAIWIAAEVAFFVFAVPHLPAVAAVAVDLVARLWLGMDAARLRLAKGARKAAVTDIIAAPDRDAAEAAFFGRLAQDASAETPRADGLDEPGTDRVPA